MTPPRILVATDVVADAKLVRELLRKEFKNVSLSTVADQAAVDFEATTPDVLVLAFKTLEQAQHYRLLLYRLSTLVHAVAHRTIVLCGSEELHQAYALCRENVFDDYALFWPMNFDASRLPMAVAHALRDLEHAQSAAPVAEMARHVRRIAELEALLELQRDRGQLHAQTASNSLDLTAEEIDAAIGLISKDVIESGLDGAVQVRNPDRVRQAFDKLKIEKIAQHLRTARAAVQPMGRWIGEVTHQLEPHVTSLRALKTLVEGFRPVVLVVDDNEFERKLVEKILQTQPYDLVFAAGCVEALGVLRKRRPDLILMDMIMPEISGLETLRRLKAVPQFASIPVMMVTGQSDRDLVLRSRNAGAVDFVVKPLDREPFLKKVARLIAG